MTLAKNLHASLDLLVMLLKAYWICSKPQQIILKDNNNSYIWQEGMSVSSFS